MAQRSKFSATARRIFVPWAALGLAVALVMTGCAAEEPERLPLLEATEAPRPGTVSPVPTAPVPGPPPGEEAAFEYAIDGDTIMTSAGKVRLIGIDTPEREECGYDEAAEAIERMLARGDTVTLHLPLGQNDEDRYGRLVRYVETDDGADLGMMQLEAGHAVARFDSLDNHPGHPREKAYRAAQQATLDPDRHVITTDCAHAAAAPISLPADEGSDWWLAYPSCAQLKRNDIGHPRGPFARDNPAEAEIYDWFAYGTGNNGDGDGDGLACE